MVSSDSIAIFVPVLFLLVVELGNITRETVPLSELANEDNAPIAVHGKRTVFGHELLPNLGRFLFIHWGSVMLSMTAFVALTLVDGLLRGGLLFASAIVLYFYPAIEISEYDELFSTGEFPGSYQNHIIHVTMIILLILLAPWAFLASELLGVQFIKQPYLWLTFFIIPFVAARSFTILLEEELSDE